MRPASYLIQLWQLMAKYFREIFKEKLYTDVDYSKKELPSPEQLKYKILIKVGLMSAHIPVLICRTEQEAAQGCR